LNESFFCESGRINRLCIIPVDFLARAGFERDGFSGNILEKERRSEMGEHCCGLRTGENVPDFKLETYEPERGDFGEVSLQALRESGKWTVLFFYPADFTFV
jgi:AhpC/TSA family